MYKNWKAKRGFALAIACLALCFAVVCGLAACTSSSSSSAASANASASSAAASASASSASAAASGTISFTDSAGRTVEVPANIERVAISGPISQMFMLTLCPEKLVGLSNALSDDEIKYVAGDIANLPVFGQIYGGKGDFLMDVVGRGDVHRVHVRALLPIHLDADEMPVQNPGNSTILEALVRHHMAPVTGTIPDAQKYRLVLCLSTGKRLLTPRIPVHGIVGVL